MAILSSSEWKLTTINFPPLFKNFVALIKPLTNSDTSLFTKILMAWKVFVAGFILLLSLIVYFFIDNVIYKLKPAKSIWAYILATYPINITGVHFKWPKKV